MKFFYKKVNVFPDGGAGNGKGDTGILQGVKQPFCSAYQMEMLFVLLAEPPVDHFLFPRVFLLVYACSFGQIFDDLFIRNPIHVVEKLLLGDPSSPKLLRDLSPGAHMLVIIKE